MKIKKIPITDLISYFNDLFADRENEDITSIPEMIEEYHYIMTQISLPVYKKIFLENWCFGNFGDVNDMPWQAGTVVRNKEGVYGLTCWLGALDYPHSEYDLLHVYWIDRGILTRSVFHPEEWTEWGTMNLFFDYNFEDNMTNVLGSRELKKGCSGRDVWLLQKLMKNFDEQVEVTMVFDKRTENKLMEIQAALSRPITGVIEPEDPLIPLLY